MNEACFNELSSFPYCLSFEEARSRVFEYSMTLKSAGIHGIKKVRYSGDLTGVLLCKDYSLQDYCNTNMKLVAVQLVLSMATKPQVPEEDDDVVEQYLNTDTCVVKEEEIISADGFNAAFCMGTYCLGFASEPFWNNPQVTITVICNGIEEEYCWYCVSSPLHYKDSSFIEWRQQFLPVVLTQTDISPFDKQVNLPSHHGKNKLIEHAKHLLDSPYVEGILTSLVFKRGANSYVMKNSDFAHGLIDIVLYWEEDGYSMRVKTTGKNTRETLLIADLLTKKYGRGK